MKALFYKFSKNLPFTLIVMLYFWVLMPLAFLSEEFGLYTSPHYFILAGIIYTIEVNDNSKSKFGTYMTCLPFKKSTYVSYLFILTIISEVIMYLSLIIVGIFSPSIFNTNLLTEYTPLHILSSMFVGMAVVGFTLFLNFRFSFAKSFITLLLSYGISMFVKGFIYGYTDSGRIENNIFDYVILRLFIGFVSAIIFVFEWWLTIRVYSKKEF